MARHYALALLGAIGSFSAMPAKGQILYDINFGAAGGLLTTSSSATVGFSFSLAESKQVTQLGLWDNGSDGLNQSHAIGLWDEATTTLLANATLTNGNSSVVVSTASEGRWLFTPITPVVLGPGSYVMGFLTGGGSGSDRFRSGATVTTDSSVTMGSSRLSYSSSLILPTTSGGIGARYGPNAMIAAVPEASSVALLMAGAAPLGLVAVRRRRRARIAE